MQLRFRTEDGLFSPTKVDHGTLAMLSVVDFSEEGKVLDLGCGYGVVGILAAKLIGPQNVIMVDNDPLAVRLAQENAELKWYKNKLIAIFGGVRIQEIEGYYVLCAEKRCSQYACKKTGI